MKTRQGESGRPPQEEPSSLGLEMVDQVEGPLDFKWVDLPVMILFWALMIIVFLQFFTRYVLNDSLGWTEEIARFLLVLVGFVGSVTAVRKGSHIFLEFLYRFIPASLAKAFSVSSELICIGFYSTCAWMSVQMAMKSHQSLVSVPLPKSAIYWVIAVSFVLMALYSLGWLIRKLGQDGESIVAELEEHVIAS